ncbi:hypothetical protein Lepto7375DRAFT_0531 [Leptolyngbya sp. PCC 7375]|nr:hypothetical protein Lepto7375DRAFT_0531 [Leptolyngbya sp. PCC 7375]
MVLETSKAVRTSLIDALRLDLIGPSTGDPSYAYETIPQAPSKWYLSGFLVPYEAKLSDRTDSDSDDSFDPQLTAKANSDDDATPEATSARKGFFPSSLGLSFLVTQQTQNITVHISWGDYIPSPSDVLETETPLQARSSIPWQRTPHESVVQLSLSPENVEQTNPLDVGQMAIPILLHQGSRQDVSDTQMAIPLHQGFRKNLAVPGSNGLELVLSVRPISQNCDLPVGTLAASLFLVNKRPAITTDAERDLAYIFQAKLTIVADTPFVPRPDLRNQALDDEDERIADLQYRNDVEYVVGHNVSATALVTDEKEHPQCTKIYTTWMPQTGNSLSRETSRS